MSRSLLAPILFFGLLAACAQEPVQVPLRSLERSGDVSFVCATSSGEGRPIDDCPAAPGVDARLLAFVTQTRRGEVAVLDVTAGKVRDLDPSTPSYGFLPVGASPRAIVSTPGGVATFVGVAEPGREGIFGLPTSCARAPVTDLTELPACALPAAPGAMAVLIDPPNDEGQLRESCGGSYSAAGGEAGRALAASGRRCTADLALETTPPGRRKLAVALPSRGELAILDAQAILDRAPGSFEPCPWERVLPLRAELPAVAEQQPLPSDLTPEPACVGVPKGGRSAPPADYRSTPADLALAAGRLYVADRSAPVVHVLDVQDPCAAAELPPLLPASYLEPDAVVTTSRVAVSPPTTRGERFAYVVEESSGSTMIFDVSRDSPSRLPLAREGSAWFAAEPPDRLSYSARAHDVDFAFRDVPLPDPVTGIAELGVACDPAPTADLDSVGAGFRTSQDYATGAGPRKLRGVFGFVALASGAVAVVDVEDLDAPCRRPRFGNPGGAMDFRGCADAPGSPMLYTLGGTAAGTATVSDEVSCRVVQPHRSRSASYEVVSSAVGVRAPALRGLPRLADPELGQLSSEQTTAGRAAPRLLAVPFDAGQAAEAFVGDVRYRAGDGEHPLATDPASATEHSVAVSYVEPRAFAPVDDVTITYEGRLTPPRTTARVSVDGELRDAAGFCARGVQDLSLARQEAERLGVASDARERFAEDHADYVQLSGELLGKEDAWWRTGGASCDGSAQGHYACEALFGTASAPTEARELRLLEAFDDRLVVEPRERGVDVTRRLALVACCFPTLSEYVVRSADQWIVAGSASGFQHDVERASDGRCVRSCDPRRRVQRGRVYETSLGARTDGSAPPLACARSGPLAPGDPCAFRSVTHSFGVYRGAAASRRDMSFTFSMTGGFSPLSAYLGGSGASLPERMFYVPQLGQLAVVDTAATGLTLVSLTSLAPSAVFF